MQEISRSLIDFLQIMKLKQGRFLLFIKGLRIVQSRLTMATRIRGDFRVRLDMQTVL